MTALLSNFKIKTLGLSNRVAVSPMCQYVAVDGKANDWHRVHLSTMALSGASLLFVESTSVEPEGRITPGDLGLWDDETQAALKSTIDTVRNVSDTKIVLQLAHAGRKASSYEPWKGGLLIDEDQGGWQTVAPSAISQLPDERLPEALDEAGIKRIIDAFAAAAKRASSLGVDGLELHFGHGYLAHQFMSPISNHRDDGYGGNLENRLRFPLEVFDAVRAAFPAEKPIGVKVSSTDWVEGGWDLEQTIAFAKEVEKHGADWITASSGGISPKQKIPVSPGYQVPFAEALKKETGLNVIAVGLITEAAQANSIIAEGKADLVALARGMLYDPRWVWHAAAALHGVIDAPPPSYWRAAPVEAGHIFKDIKHGAR